jgi:hypothetical protein
MLLLSISAIPTVLWGLLVPHAAKKILLVDVASLSVLAGTVFLQIEELIPASAWAQYPLVAIGAVLAGVLMRFWVSNEEKWRQFVREERLRAETFIMTMMKEQREAHEKILTAVSESQRAAYEEALERFLNATIVASGGKSGRGGDRQ